MERCPWAAGDRAMERYHDEEWGVPEHDDGRLFEFLVLETFQAGLSWRTVLHKRDAFRRAFAGFDPERVAAFGDDEIARLLNDASLIRNRAKVHAAVSNARAFLEVRERYGSFDGYSWSFVGGCPRQNAWRRPEEVPATTAEAEAFSDDLKQHGFRFVGPTIVYAHMQATGMVNDHLLGCPRHAEVASLQ